MTREKISINFFFSLRWIKIGKSGKRRKNGISDNSWGISPLHVACEIGDKNLVQILFSPLHVASIRLPDENFTYKCPKTHITLYRNVPGTCVIYWVIVGLACQSLEIIAAVDLDIAKKELFYSLVEAKTQLQVISL